MREEYKNKPEDYYSLDRSMLMPFVPDNLEKILDVGCGEGVFSKRLKEDKGVKEAWGVEFFDGAIKKAEENLEKVIPLAIEDAIDLLPEAYFDCIFFNDVLEHLQDPYNVLKRIRSKCRNDGYIIASIPNILNFETIYQIILKQDWEYKDYGIMDRTHLRFFTAKSMHRMFTEAGYEVKKVSGINEFYGKKFWLLNKILFNKLNQMKYVQMVVVAKPLRAQ